MKPKTHSRDNCENLTKMKLRVTCKNAPGKKTGYFDINKKSVYWNLYF